jgi:hypothetical protein
MFTIQDPANPLAVIDSLRNLVSADTRELDIAVAYVTLPGAKMFHGEVGIATGAQRGKLPCTVVTLFDFGHTEPDALDFLVAEGYRVRISNLGPGGRVRLQPSTSAFHPKLYIAAGMAVANVMVGSPNLSRRALTVNVEAFSREVQPAAQWQPMWGRMTALSEPLTPTVLADYRRLRPTIPRPEPDEPPAPQPLPEPDRISESLADAIAIGLRPSDFTGFWLEVGYASGGSKNQVELPRGAAGFFGFDFDDYSNDQITIGNPVVRVSGHASARVLSWHGDNKMERINVPTVAQGGVPVAHRVVLFLREHGGFQMRVVDEGSRHHVAWLTESAAHRRLYQLGQSSKTVRRCGLL